MSHTTPPPVESGAVIDRLARRIADLEREIAIRDAQIDSLCTRLDAHDTKKEEPHE